MNSLFLLRRLAYITLGLFDTLVGNTAPVAFILCYHSANNSSNRFSIDTDIILEQITFLSQKYTPVSLDDIINYVMGKKTFDTPVFAITFDDGYESLLTLKDLPARLGVAPTVFALSAPQQASRAQLANQESLLTYEQLKILHASGWDIGCHSATHPEFKSLTGQALHKEIADAKRTLEHHLGIAIQYFAYPKGAYTEKTVQTVRTSHFKAAFTMNDTTMRPGINLFTLPRIGVDKTHQISEFKYLWSPSNIKLRSLLKKFNSFLT